MKIDELADNSRVWVYQANRLLTDEEVELISKSGENFIQEWATHGTKLLAGVNVYNRLFVILAADEDQVKASGCSIDGSVRWIKEVGQNLNIDFFNRLLIAVKSQKSENIELIPLHDLQSKFENGAVQESDIIFNTLIKNLKEFKNSFEIPLKDSWVYQRVTH